MICLPEYSKRKDFIILKTPKQKEQDNLVFRALKSSTFLTQSLAASSFCLRIEMSIPVSLQIERHYSLRGTYLPCLCREILVTVKRKWEFTDQVLTEPNDWMMKWTGQIKIIYNFNTETVFITFDVFYLIYL